LSFTPEALKGIAEIALKEKTGARGLRTALEDLLMDVMFHIPNRPDIVKCIVEEDTVRHGRPPILLNASGETVDYTTPAPEVEPKPEPIEQHSFEQESA
jgi:ATP-dependent Clp protease ATP-binding subunit ClpX